MPEYRDPLFDVLKGVAIFLVVTGHVSLFCLNGMEESVLIKLIGAIHMPLFFFISGWFAYRTTSKGSVANTSLSVKFRRIMLPMLVVSGLYVLYCRSGQAFTFVENATYSSLWLDLGKYGYWFPVTLFEIFVLYAMIVPFINHIRGSVWKLAFIAAIYILLLGLTFIPSLKLRIILQLSSLVSYFPCFIIGAICHRYDSLFYRLCSGSRWMTFIIAIIIFPLYSQCWPDDIGEHMGLFNTLTTPVVHTCLAFIAFAIFRPWINGRTSGSHSHAIRFWAYLGRNSFGIYLLHYFCLFPLMFVPASFTIYFLPALVICVSAAAAIIAITCGIIELLRPSVGLSEILTGSK